MFWSLFEEFYDNVQLNCLKLGTSCLKCKFSLCAEVYGRGGSYNAFSGKDASRAIAKWSMSEEDLNDNLVRT